ncbi:MAG TPA: hypothetical protein VFD84_13270 [Candidatus Binatia bacterium]|nr:hypothetical protein [Candidatus Binatia bacterium]
MSDGNGNGGAREGWVLFVSSPTGYTLSERDGEPPSVGSELEENGRTLVVTKLGASPLPGDRRPCAFSIGKS